ncbi:flavoprotein [Streptomyces varsoviensis]|uniref:Flavoprotein n=1 Tax=Streptomyces varsoviensis TaxID=67373 RepID=A0ABR5J843_9ACTN|nr:flavoprotein [Streptomyces varsoviensis]KOG89590.1 flavoprotein [Streptomyces varsoviensis]
MTTRVLYLLGSAAPPVLNVANVIRQAQGQGWEVCLGLTPTAARWLEGQLPELAELTGYPVRSQYKIPGEPDVWPSADVAAVAPATFNTINQWALGLTNHFVVGFVVEAIGKGIPLVTMPCVNKAFAQHPQFQRSVDVLRGAGVSVLYGEDGFVPNEPGKGQPENFPWGLALSEAARLAVRGSVDGG